MLLLLHIIYYYDNIFICFCIAHLKMRFTVLSHVSLIFYRYQTTTDFSKELLLPGLLKCKKYQNCRFWV